jgi:hypothetical protein
MIVRELPDGRVLAITQENHADLSAQFAAHWGSGAFARLAPYETLVFATTYHDSGHREVDAEVPFDLEHCQPYGHRNTPAERRKPEAIAANNQWLCDRDVYSGLLVSMHHTGLRKQRYGTIASWQTNGQGQPSDHDTFAGMDRAFEDLEPWQKAHAKTLGLDEPVKRRAFWTNYCALQVFDLLSLYFCLDGYAGERIVETSLVGIPTAYAGDAVADLHITPIQNGVVRMDPFPLDAPLRVVVPARILAPRLYATEAEGRTAFYEAPRQALEWEITA